MVERPEDQTREANRGRERQKNPLPTLPVPQEVPAERDWSLRRCPVPQEVPRGEGLEPSQVPGATGSTRGEELEPSQVASAGLKRGFVPNAKSGAQRAGLRRGGRRPPASEGKDAVICESGLPAWRGGVCHPARTLCLGQGDREEMGLKEGKEAGTNIKEYLPPSRCVPRPRRHRVGASVQQPGINIPGNP